MSLVLEDTGFYAEEFEVFLDKEIKPILNDLERIMTKWLVNSNGRNVQDAWREVEDLVSIKREDAWLTAAYITQRAEENERS